MGEKGREIARGAEARIFLASLFGEKVLIKFRDEKRYRIKELDETLRKKRTKNEARIILKASEKVMVPKIFCVSGPEIYMEFLRGKLLRDIKNKKKYLKKVGEILTSLHGMDICHGDFTPANIIVGRDIYDIYVIDFGLAIFSKDIEDKAVDVLLMKKSLNKDEYNEFLKGYNYEKEKILERVKEIEKRGRYFVRK
jgi:Kae1-associated kinase Bud32